MPVGGQPGNTNGTKDKRLITDALRRVVTQSPEKLKKACEKILDDAQDGNLAAFAVIADRLDGKPAQTTILAGDEDNPLVTTIEIIPLVNETDTDTK